MTDSEVIAQLAKENVELKERVKQYQEITSTINDILYCVGGPLNDNVQQFNKEQLRTMFRIAEVITYGVDDE